MSFDVQTGATEEVGNHDDAIRCVEFAPSVNQIVTGGWDSCVKLWDPRTGACTASAKQPASVSKRLFYSSSLLLDESISTPTSEKYNVTTGFVLARKLFRRSLILN